MIARKQKNNLKEFNNKKYEILITNANKCENPLELIATTDDKFEIQCSRSADLDADKLEWIMRLTEENMKEFYAKSEWGWQESDKRKELTHKTAYILMVKDKLNSANCCAFAHFRFEFDDDKFKGNLILFLFLFLNTKNILKCVFFSNLGVIYCYELQIAKEYQRQGIGTLLMNLIKQIGIQFKMNKVLLTCFGYNEAAMNFYVKKLNYSIDRSSPSRCVEGKTFYEILSLKINH